MNVCNGLVILAFSLILLGLSLSGDTDTGTVLPKASADSRTYGGKIRGTTYKRLFVEGKKRWLKAGQVSRMVSLSSGVNGVVFYGYGKIKDFTASAPGMDSRHHIVNSYLVGYSPFKAKNVWIPWQVIAQKKQYLSDELFLEDGRTEAWQTSREAHKLTRGDCEDHAIALADWLINMGRDARVVLGTQDGGGHAWVVLFLEGKEFLLEATRKTAIRQMITLPLAKLQQGYSPGYMFNRTQFWKNSGSLATSNYSSSAWVQKSQYR